MSEPEYLTSPQGRRLAFHRTPGRGPGVVFLGGYGSDMTGMKALHLEGWAGASGRAFLRFDYSGHGESSGRFEDGCIGDWTADAAAVIAAATSGPQVLIGSSMGGWIALLLAREGRVPVAGLVGVAAAPDFTEDGMMPSFTEAEHRALLRESRVERPSSHGTPQVITRRLIDDGRMRLVLRAPLALPFPVRLLHGGADAEVPVSVPFRLMAHATCEDLHLTVVKGADHRFSTPECLALLVRTAETMCEARGAVPGGAGP